MKSVQTIAREVIAGDWGSGDVRKNALEKAGYNYNTIQTEVTRMLNSRDATIENMEIWARKIAADNRYHYNKWSSVQQSHLCPICSGLTYEKDPVHFGWNCIGFGFAVWHHGGGIPCKCNCGVISNGVGQKIFDAKTDAEALTMVKKCVGINDLIIIRDIKNTVPRSKWQAGDIVMCIDSKKTFSHIAYYAGNGIFIDAIGSNGQVPNDTQIATRSWKTYAAGILIRFTGRSQKTTDQLVQEVLAGKWGAGEARKQKLTEFGYDYNLIQSKINQSTNTGGNNMAIKKDITTVANEVLDGQWSSGESRKISLTNAGYDYNAVQKEVTRLLETNGSRAAVIANMEAWATKIAANNKYRYIYWNELYGKECPICHPHDGKNEGWQCIGFAFAIWHHGGRLKSKCNCGVIANETWEKILNAKTDAEALKIAREHVGIKEIQVIRNKNGIPKSQIKPGDIGASFVENNKYKHTYFIMHNNKVADSTKTNNAANDIRADRALAGRYVNGCKVIIRYTGNGTGSSSTPQPTLKPINTIAQEVLDGKWGSGDTRKQKLEKAGYDYTAVQKVVNELVKAKEQEDAKKIDQIAKEVLADKWGSGDERKKKLTAAGYDYDKVQKRVNELVAQQKPGKQSYSGTFPSLTIKKSNAEVIEDTIKWALWIAGDNDFHYGYTSPDKKANAHHNGCYFCGTQRMKKNMLMPEHTYCCNPFVGAAWAHGGCVPAALKLCQNTKSWGFSKNNGYATSSLFTNLGHPDKSKLKKGDVLCKDTHVALYIGDGKIVQAGGGDDNKKNSARWNKSISVSKLTDTSYKNFPRVHRFNGSVDTTMNIRHGELSKRVAQWQAFLDWYFDGKVGKADGCYGDNTLKWTKKFQEEVIGKGQGDGIIGPKTIEAAKKIKK